MMHPLPRLLLLSALALPAGAAALSLSKGPALAQTLTPPPPAPIENPKSKIESSYPNPDPKRYLFEDQIKPGMKGFGLTVMQAGKIEKFSVEVIDVMANFAPATNAILIKCSGLGLEHSGIIAGMSGSPVYLDTPEGPRMIGAVAFGWGSSKDPIGGVQPIRQMLSIPCQERSPNQPPLPRAGGGARWLPTSTSPLRSAALHSPAYSALLKNLYPSSQRLASSSVSSVKSADRSLRNLDSPLMVANVNPAGMAYLQAAFAHTGLVPLESGAAPATPNAGQNPALGGLADLKTALKLEPGAALAIPLVSGDLDASAIGTVTEVSDGRVWAFGHAMFADGPTAALPIATSYIYTILPNVVQSFKIGASYQTQGALLADEQTGIVGRLGAKAPTVPVAITVQGPTGQPTTYHYQLAPHPKLTPELLGLCLQQSLFAKQQLPKDYTLRLTGSVSFGGTTLKLDSLATSPQFDPAAAILPIALLTDNPFEDLPLSGLDLTAEIQRVNAAATIQSVTLDHTVAAPGDTLTATVEFKPFQQPPRSLPIALTIPADTPDGDYELCVGSSDDMLQQETQYFPQRFDPRDIGALVKDLQHILAYKSDRLYARLVTNVTGVAAGGVERAHLPASRRAIFASDKRTDATPLYEATLVSVAADAVLESAGQTFTITVDRNADRRFFSQRDHTPAPPVVPAPASKPLGATPTHPAPDHGGGGDDPGPSPGN